jgi:hypothetical protein
MYISQNVLENTATDVNLTNITYALTRQKWQPGSKYNKYRIIHLL